MNKALIAGASGIVGRHIVEHLLALGGWQVVGLSRRPLAAAEKYQHVTLDLLDRTACASALGELEGVSHVFYAGRAPRPNGAEEALVNQAMLVNLMECLGPDSIALQHVNLMHGAKWYGSHLGPYKTPAKEDDPRCLPPNFYYQQQDYIEQLQHDRAWTWSALRPHLVCGVSSNYPHNTMAVLAVYAAICRELKLPLRFPGTPGCFTSLSQFTDAKLLSRAMHWAATTPACAGQAFNIINGDYFRWQNLWPQIAEFFDLPVGPVQTIKLAEFMADKEPLWAAMVEKYGLQQQRLDELVNWGYGDFVFAVDWDDLCATTKARQYGFHDVLDTEDMVLRVLGEYRAQKIIP